MQARTALVDHSVIEMVLDEAPTRVLLVPSVTARAAAAATSMTTATRAASVLRVMLGFLPRRLCLQDAGRFSHLPTGQPPAGDGLWRHSASATRFPSRFFRYWPERTWRDSSGPRCAGTLAIAMSSVCMSAGEAQVTLALLLMLAGPSSSAGARALAELLQARDFGQAAEALTTWAEEAH